MEHDYYDSPVSMHQSCRPRRSRHSEEYKWDRIGRGSELIIVYPRGNFVVVAS